MTKNKNATLAQKYEQLERDVIERLKGFVERSEEESAFTSQKAVFINPKYGFSEIVVIKDELVFFSKSGNRYPANEVLSLLTLIEIAEGLFHKANFHPVFGDLRKARLEDFDFSVRAQSFFKSADIRTMAELQAFDLSEIPKYRNTGKKTVEHIIWIMKYYNLEFNSRAQ